MDLLSAGFIEKFIRFGIVGASGVLIDFSITYVAKETLKVNKYFANSAGFVAAATSNFVLNRYWTFENQDPEILTQFGKFFLIALVGLVINNLLIWVFNERLKMNFYLSKAFAIVLVMFWNFFANYLYTFSIA